MSFPLRLAYRCRFLALLGLLLDQDVLFVVLDRLWTTFAASGSTLLMTTILPHLTHSFAIRSASC